MTHVLKQGECLHCAVRDLIVDDICLNETTPTMQGGALGQAIGDCIALDDQEQDSADYRYIMCVEAVAAFALAMCRAAKIPKHHPAEQILFDAGKHSKDIVLVGRKY